MTNGLEAVSSGLLVANVGVEGSIPGRSCEVLAVFERNMLAVTGLVALSQTEVDDVDGVLGCLSASSHEVVGLDVSMDDSFFVNNLNSLEHLNCNMKNS